LVSADGFIVTNAHVVGQCRSMKARHISGGARRSYEPALKYYDEKSDTAVLKVAGQGLDFFNILAPPTRVGERVYAIGNPRGLEQSISEGIASGNREDDGVFWIQHSAPISPGSSGGALISSRGELLGINSCTKRESQNLNFAVPAGTLARALSDARAMAGVIRLPPSAKAQLSIGLLYDTGDDVGRDYNEAATWFRAAAEQGNAEAQLKLGILYTEGHGVPQDDTQAAEWYDKAAEQANAEAQATFGALYELGRGVPQNYNLAAAWYRKAADQGYARAQNLLGNLYSEGQGVSQDCVEAAVWYRRAADQGNANAQYHLGILYYEGHGVPRDATQAAAWNRKAAEQGKSEAQRDLGAAYQVGSSVPQDYSQAAAWYRKAADQGDSVAEYLLGILYYAGHGVPQNDGESYFWIRVASAGKVEGKKPEDIAAQLDAIATHLTAADLAQQQKRAREWLTAHPTRAR